MKVTTRLGTYWTAVRHAIRKRGLLANLRLIRAEIAFDLRYGTDTFRMVELADIEDVSPEEKASSVHYQAVNVLFFDQALAAIGTDFSRDVFVDYGCGKGRALMLAARLGFRRAIGVEFSATLCEACRRNIQTFKRRAGVTTAIEVFQQNAADFVVPHDATIFFFFNPFDETVLTPVLDEIRRSLVSHPREATAIYVNPRHQAVFTARGFRKLHSVQVSPPHEDAVVFRLKGP